MVNRRPHLLAFALGLVLGGAACKLYNPEIVDCSIRCGEKDACPANTVCKEGFCRIPDSTNLCDCQPNETRECGGGKGECNPGIQRCNANGTWTPCLGEGKPTEERCDNKDNNCDGVPDNSVADPPECYKFLGVCAQARQACVSGSFVPCVEADYGPLYEPVETTCDGLDNDCDGLVDGVPEKQLATNVGGDWEILAYDGGFALVYVRPTAQPPFDDVVVTRFDESFNNLGTTTTVTTAPSPGLAASNDDSNVYVAWANDGGLSAARVSLSGTVTRLPAVTAAQTEVSDKLHCGLSSARFVVGFMARNDTVARSVEWPRDAGAAVVRSFNLRPDGGLITSDLLSVNVSRGGQYFSYRFEVKTYDDAGSSTTDYFTNTLATGGTTIVSDQYAGNSSTSLLEQGNKLVAAYDYRYISFFPFFPSKSGIYFINNVLDGGSEVTVRESSDPTQWLGSHAVMLPQGAVLAYVDNLNSRIVMSLQRPVSGTSIFRNRVIESDAGYGIPRLAATHNPFIGLAWESSGVISARRICAP